MSLIDQLKHQLVTFSKEWGYKATEVQVGPEIWNDFYVEVVGGTTHKYSIDWSNGNQLNLKVFGLPVVKGRWGIYVCDPSKTMMGVQDFSHTWPSLLNMSDYAKYKHSVLKNSFKEAVGNIHDEIVKEISDQATKDIEKIVFGIDLASKKPVNFPTYDVHASHILGAKKWP